MQIPPADFGQGVFNGLRRDEFWYVESNIQHLNRNRTVVQILESRIS